MVLYKISAKSLNHLFPKKFIPNKASATVQAIKFVQLGQEVCPAGEYLWLDMLRAADES